MTCTTTAPTAAKPNDERPAGRREVGVLCPVRSWLAVAASLGSGLALWFAFPPYGLWWLAPLAVAALAVAVRGRRVRAGARLGLLAGLAFFLPLLSWANLHTGYVPWLLLSVAEACFVALLAAGAAWAGPIVDRYWWAWPPLTGLLWVAMEAARGRVPFGGFPWGRLAFSQGDSPLLRLAVVGGAPLVTFAVGSVGGLIAAALWACRGGFATPAGWRRHQDGSPPLDRPWRSWLLALGWAGGAVVCTAASVAVPVGSPAGPMVTVAVVQGNVPRLGLDFNAQRQQVLNNHVDATLDLADQVAAGRRPQPDLVVWPENASDIDPVRWPEAAASIDRAAEAIDAPILVGTMLYGPGEDRRNVGIAWRAGVPAEDQKFYAKRRPVPFAEYIPLRRIAALVSDKVELVRRDMVGGTAPGVLRMGPAVVGDVICFEVAIDNVVRDTVTGGAQLIVVQTNNATFDVAEATQQMAMVRLRAVEHGRVALMASTVGVSGFVSADGTVYDETSFNTRAVLVRQVRLGDGRTLATRLGAWPEVGLATLAVLGLVGAAVPRLVSRRNAVRASGSGGAGGAGQAAVSGTPAAAGKVEQS